MNRTPLLRAVRRAVRAAADPGTGALSRRRLLTLAGTAALTACATPRPGRVGGRRIAVVGGGLAGLTAAFRLHQAGESPIVYEASRRWGGRVRTLRDFNADGMFCELGAEMVDTHHTALRALAAELGVGITPLAEDGPGHDLYYFDGRWIGPSSLIDAAQGGLFVPLAERIAADRRKLLTRDDQWTDHARTLDQLSIDAYLTSLPSTAPWVKALLRVAYRCEFGLETDVQSALNLVDFIGTESDQFRLYGDSDEAWRIEGGSSRLVDAMVARLESRARLELEHALVRIDADADPIRLTFETPAGRSSVVVDRVVLALPLTTLRRVKGLDTLALPPDQREAVMRLGYGTNAKIMLGAETPQWRTVGADRPAATSGTMYTDLDAQLFFDTSRAQTGPRGITTNYLGGRAGTEPAAARAAIARRDFARMVPEIRWDGRQASAFWAAAPWALGSYACARVGQYTRLLESVGRPAANGRVHFAGEHGSIASQGYMNGAIESGAAAAAKLAAE